MAASLLDELVRAQDDAELVVRYPWLPEVGVRCSTQVRKSMATDPRHFEVRDVDWRSGRWTGSDTDVTLTVFGPHYGRRPAGKHVVGFADVTLVYPEVSATSGCWRRTRRGIRNRVARWSFRRADLILVESPALVPRLEAQLGIDPSRVRVVPNTVNAAFHAARVPFAVPDSRAAAGEPIRLLYVARPYPHKNHRLLFEAIRRVNEETALEVELTVTLTAEEVRELDAGLPGEMIRSVGVVPLDQLPDLYASSDAVIFPSLLESFSATPIEAMTMRKPLLASDRDFVKAFCGAYPRYFEPLSVESIIDAITDIPNLLLLDWHEAAASSALEGANGGRRRLEQCLDAIDSLLPVGGGAR